MKTCYQCQAQNPDDNSFCNHCKANIALVASQSLGYFKCPYCQSTAGVSFTSSLSTGGIVVLIVLLIACFPLFWIGLLIRDYHQHCKGCGSSLDGVLPREIEGF